MLFKLLEKIKFLVPFGILVLLYEYNKAIPANIRTSSGRFLKAIMISKNYGMLISRDKYIQNRTQLLKTQKVKLEKANLTLAKEINELSFEMREELFNGMEE